jgi:hypothetical protein
MRTMKWIVTVAGALAMLLAGCGNSSGPADRQGDNGGGTAECVPQVRFEGTIYSGLMGGANEVPLGDEIGEADVAVCDDTGESPIGPYFPPDPDQAEVWALADYPISKVIGVQRSSGLSVYANTDMSRARFEAITDELVALIEQAER